MSLNFVLLGHRKVQSPLFNKKGKNIYTSANLFHDLLICDHSYLFFLHNFKLVKPTATIELFI